MSACEAEWDLFGIFMTCGLDAEGRYRRACVHEHVREGFLCTEHAEVPDFTYCGTCRESDGHLCPLGIERIEDVSVVAS